MTVAFALLAALGGVAHASSIQIQPGTVLQPAPGSFYENGVGAPSVAYHPGLGLFVMVFETRLPTTSANCPVGQWALGIAFSQNGVNWQVDTEPLLEPAAGTYYSCVAAQPAVLFDGVTWRVWFKSEQGNDACAVDEPVWGCNRQTGIGYFELDDQSGLVTVSDEPAIAGPGMSYPSVAILEDGWHMALTVYNEVYVGTSADGLAWTLEPDAVFPKGVETWGMSEMINPVLACREGISTPIFMSYGGRTTSGTDITSAAWTIGRSPDGLTWTADPTTVVEWTGGDQWRHWDLMRFARNDYIVWFTEKDGTGKVRVRLGYTRPSWSPRKLSPRICPTPAEYGALFP